MRVPWGKRRYTKVSSVWNIFFSSAMGDQEGQFSFLWQAGCNQQFLFWAGVIPSLFSSQPSPGHTEVSPPFSRPAAAALPTPALYLPSYASPSAAFSQLTDCHSFTGLTSFSSSKKPQTQPPNPNNNISAASGWLQLFGWFWKVLCIRQGMLRHAKAALNNSALTFPILLSSPVVCSWVPSTRPQDGWYTPPGHCQLPYMSFSYRDWMKTYTVLEC